MGEMIQQTALVPERQGGRRLDQVATGCFPDYSRSRVQSWIKSGALRVDGKQGRAKDKVRARQVLTLIAELESDKRWEPEAIPLNIVFEDAHVLVINKPAGLVVHPGAGNYSGTLLNGLLHHEPALSKIPRAGIVHRLDKDTTGLMVVAKNLQAQANLVNQLQARTVKREYEAVVQGLMTRGGNVEKPIGRHPSNRLKMGVIASGKYAATQYRLIERYRAHTHIKLQLETGRTHQIRVHMAHLRFPLIGDPLYGRSLRLPKKCGDTLKEQLQGFRRQALHARQLGLIHPDTQKHMQWEVPLPDDMVALLVALQQDRETIHEQTPGE
ncbi:23S rRNA pseudouridine(1911/1915/1917) synthase RluD [Candidatus Sororendozoicomonas aggregata]|uniref:23S rRNA pseudouridine(1911/1915/1917) synthase RluD n=1 Tax=Candidatus Sororendozoicomonas aggregata TaxID=3073239 RepID=UPI002ED0F2E2